jgi:hypothetical protein
MKKLKLTIFLNKENHIPTFEVISLQSDFTGVTFIIEAHEEIPVEITNNFQYERRECDDNRSIVQVWYSVMNENGIQVDMAQ